MRISSPSDLERMIQKFLIAMLLHYPPKRTGISLKKNIPEAKASTSEVDPLYRQFSIASGKPRAWPGQCLRSFCPKSFCDSRHHFSFRFVSTAPFPASGEQSSIDSSTCDAIKSSSEFGSLWRQQHAKRVHCNEEVVISRNCMPFCHKMAGKATLRFGSAAARSWAWSDGW